MNTRKNQTSLSPNEWNDLIDAINKTHGMGIPRPRYRDFVKVHMRAMNPADPVGMSWGVHTMGPMMPGRNFLAWHRQFILQFERRLQVVHPNVTLPYWNAIVDRKIPKPLDAPALLSSWGVTRNWDPTQLATQADLNAANSMVTFTLFQRTLEGAVHGSVHNAVGGDMASSASPTDPLFWLHHANIDRLWAEWQKKHPGQNPPNGAEVLQPKPIFGVKVSSVLSISTLGYQYQ